MPQPGQHQGLDMGDIYFVLFRHWKMIAGALLVGVIAAGIAYRKVQPMYTSEAKLLVKFIQERKSINPTAVDSQTMSPDSRGENIMSSEVEIFSSADLLPEVVEAIGAEKILAKVGGGTNRIAAANYLRRYTRVDNPKRTSIIYLSLSHPDPDLLQPILQRLIEAYKNKHKEIHRSLGPVDELIKRQRDSLKLALTDTEGELLRIQTNSGIVSIEDSKKALTERINHLSDQIATAEAQLAEAKAALPEGQRGKPEPLGTNQPISAATNPASGTAAASSGASKATNAVAAAAIPQDKIDAFKAAKADLELLEKREKESLKQYTEIHPAVRRVRLLIAEAQRQVWSYLSNYPGISTQAALSPSTASSLNSAMTANNGRSQNPADTTVNVAALVAGLEAKIAIWRDKLRQAQLAATELVEAEMKIQQLRRTKDLQDTTLRYYNTSLEQVAVDEALGPGKVRGIDDIQKPSTPIGDQSSRLKITLALLVGPIGLALLLAFALEFFLDRTVKRPSDVENKAHVPLFVSIPNRDSMAKAPRNSTLSLGHKPRKELPAPGSETLPKTPDKVGAGPVEESVMIPAALDEQHGLQPFFETLRDRLVSFFDKNNMTHKPKLVAVTGCHASSGVTTVVAGLAASLSNSGDGNVLVVDMKSEGGAVQHFFRGKQQIGLLDVLDESRRGEAQVQENLYVVSEQDLNGSLPKILHKRFVGIIPKLKLSNYDYIIFDLPPMSQTSIAPRVARFMDMMLIVAEAEKTHVELIRQSARLLSESGANVGAVLNRTQNHVPQRFTHELM